MKIKRCKSNQTMKCGHLTKNKRCVYKEETTLTFTILTCVLAARGKPSFETVNWPLISCNYETPKSVSYSNLSTLFLRTIYLYIVNNITAIYRKMHFLASKEIKHAGYKHRPLNLLLLTLLEKSARYEGRSRILRKQANAKSFKGRLAPGLAGLVTRAIIVSLLFVEKISLTYRG